MDKWTKEDTDALLAFKKVVDSDNIKIKEQIKEILLNNRFIIHVLDNKELEDAEAEPDDYYGINILPYYMVPDSQTNVKNFICYEVGYDELFRYNSNMKNLLITFHILCHDGNVIDKETGIARHDLLAALIQDQFNLTTYFGSRILLESDKPSTTDTHYATRTLIFRQQTDNNLVKTQKGISKIINKEVQPVAKI